MSFKNNTFYYSIEIRNKNSKLYKTEDGKKVISFNFTDENDKKETILFICKIEYQKYKAICKKGSVITIEVSYLDNISGTYSTLYSFDGKEFKKY
jgi:hypothetical protein